MNRKTSTGLVDCGHALRNLVLFIVLADVGKILSKPNRIRVQLPVQGIPSESRALSSLKQVVIEHDS